MDELPIKDYNKGELYEALKSKGLKMGYKTFIDHLNNLIGGNETQIETFKKRKTLTPHEVRVFIEAFV